MSSGNAAAEREWATIYNALQFYSDPRNWQEDDWGVVAVLSGRKRGEGYGKPTVKAKKALDALRRLRRV